MLATDLHGEIPKHVFEALRSPDGKPHYPPRWALLEVAKTVGMIPPDAQRLGTNTGKTVNDVINFLDEVHPNWRGYSVGTIGYLPSVDEVEIKVNFDPNLWYLVRDMQGVLHIYSDNRVQTWIASDSVYLDWLKVLKTGTWGQVNLYKELLEEWRNETNR